MKVKVLGIATSNNEYLQNWIEGLKYGNIDFEVLGMGEKYTGHKMKSKKYLQAMFSQPEVDIFILSDTYDVVINKDTVDRVLKSYPSIEDYIVDVFLRFGTPIVVGAEKACFLKCVDFSVTNLTNVLYDDHRFLNSGLIIGYRDYIISMCQMMTKYDDDQVAVGSIRKQHPEWFSLDVKSELFYNNFNININKKRMNRALFLHFPGINHHHGPRESYNSMTQQGYQPGTKNRTTISQKIFLIVLLLVVLIMVI